MSDTSYDEMIDELGRHSQFRGQLRERGERYVLGVHDDSGPGGAVADVSRTWTAAKSAMAIADAVATRPPVDDLPQWQRVTSDIRTR